MTIGRIAAAGALIVGMSVPALAHVASADAGSGPTQFKLDVAAGQSGETAKANDSDTAAELNVDDGQKEQVGEQEEANEVGTKESGSVANDQSTANVEEHQGGEHGDHGVTGTVTTPPGAAVGAGNQTGQAND